MTTAQYGNAIETADRQLRDFAIKTLEVRALPVKRAFVINDDDPAALVILTAMRINGVARVYEMPAGACDFTLLESLLLLYGQATQ